MTGVVPLLPPTPGVLSSDGQGKLYVSFEIHIWHKLLALCTRIFDPIPIATSGKSGHCHFGQIGSHALFRKNCAHLVTC